MMTDGGALKGCPSDAQHHFSTAPAARRKTTVRVDSLASLVSYNWH